MTHPDPFPFTLSQLVDGAIFAEVAMVEVLVDVVMVINGYCKLLAFINCFVDSFCVHR